MRHLVILGKVLFRARDISSFAVLARRTYAQLHQNGVNGRQDEMGRRSTHTPDQLRQLILDAAQAIIEDAGLAGLSAREIARRIGYSPGTIYNMFKNLDDVVLHVEARVLEALDARLQGVLAQPGSPPERVRKLAQTYLEFTHEKPRLWNLLFEHYMPGNAETPAWYQDRLEGLLLRVEEAMKPMFPADDPISHKRTARVLWAGVHGITSLSTANKLANVTTETAGLLVEDLVDNYLAGLAVNHPRPKA